MVRDRAYRRAQGFRAKQRAGRTLQISYRAQSKFTSAEIGILAETAKPCSCDMCGNPRRHFTELSVQERRANMRDRFKHHYDPYQSFYEQPGWLYA